MSLEIEQREREGIVVFEMNGRVTMGPEATALRAEVAKIAVNTWTFTNAPNQNFRLKVVTRYKTIKNRVRTDSTETTIPCNVFG